MNRTVNSVKKFIGKTPFGYYDTDIIEKIEIDIYINVK